MRIRALKTYRCGEPPGGTTAPPKAIASLMVKLLGEHGRIIKGAEYQTFPVELGKALVKDKAAEEF